MKGIRFLVLAVMSVVVMSVSGQTTTLKGVLKDSTLNEPEPFGTVRVFSKGNKSNPKAMFLTKDDGSFSQAVSGKGVFTVVFSGVGKEDKSISVELGSQSVVDLGTVLIRENATALQGVEIVAQKPLVKMEVDRMSYNVAEDADSKSSTVLDMLRKVPMVTVDGQDNITVNGSSSFKIYVDGKPNVMFQSNPSMVFKSMPASAVKNIEVITNPGAKYEAEGVGGVLNIIMNRMDPVAMQSLDGMTGTVRATVGNKNVGGGVFLSGQQGKLSYSANTFYQQSFPMETKVDGSQTTNAGTILTQSDSKTSFPFLMGNISLGYDLTPMSSINATFSINSMRMKNTGHPTSTMLGSMYGEEGFTYGYDNILINRRTSMSGSVDYQQFFNKERTHSIVFTYQISNSPLKNSLRNTFEGTSTSFIDLTDRYSDGRDNTTDHIFQVDYSLPLGLGHSLDLGSKLLLHNATSESKYYLNDIYNEALSMDYSYKNTVLAGYAEYSGKWNKFGAKAGMRYEQTWQNVEYRLGTGQDFSTHYGNIVPTASVSYSLAPTTNIGLTYNMRISRPGITYLNPYVNRANPTSISYGNSDLDVEKSHNVSLVFNTFSQKLMLNATLRYSYSGNGIDQYSFYDGNILNTTYGNIVKRNQIGLNVYANWLMAKNTRLFLNGGVDYTDMRSDMLGLSNSGWHFNTMAGLQQTLPWDLKLGAYLINSSKTYTMQGWSTGFNIVTMSLSKTFFNDKLSVGLQALTGLSSGGNIKMDTYIKGNDMEVMQHIRVPIKSISLTVSYTFGKKNQQMKQQHRSRVENDYIEQQSQGEMLNNMGNGGMQQQQPQ